MASTTASAYSDQPAVSSAAGNRIAIASCPREASSGTSRCHSQGRRPHRGLEHRSQCFPLYQGSTRGQEVQTPGGDGHGMVRADGGQAGAVMSGGGESDSERPPRAAVDRAKGWSGWVRFPAGTALPCPPTAGRAVPPGQRALGHGLLAHLTTGSRTRHSGGRDRLGYVGYELNFKPREFVSSGSRQEAQNPVVFTVFDESRVGRHSMGFRGSPVQIRPSRLL
jgi:hypothetical protein